MCGIAGFCLNPDEHVNSRRLAQLLLLGIEHRGKDATGAAWRDRRGNTQVQKHHIEASKFVPGLSLDKKADVAILHTRFATQGTEWDNVNNHPISAGRITGVHNGMVSNDYELIREAKDYERQGQVDSEAIFASINRVNGKYSLTDALEAPEADMALAWLDETDPVPGTLHLARGEARPLIVAQTIHGSTIFASEKKVIDAAAKDLGLTMTYFEHVKEGTYYKVREGRIITSIPFFPTPSWSSYVTRGNTTVITSSTNHTVPRKEPDSRRFVDLNYLDVDRPIPKMSRDTFEKTYVQRTKEIEAWIDANAYDGVTGEALDGDRLLIRACERGALIRPGDWVSTDVIEDMCDAQVYRLPNQFPGGEYLLRVLVPTLDEQNRVIGREVIFVSRYLFQFDGACLHPDTTMNDTTTNKEVALATDA